MTNNTQTKMAAILAAAQEKVNQQTKTAFPFRQATNFEALQPAKPEVKDYDNLQDIEKAAKDGQVISLLNLSNLVNQKQPEPIPAPAAPKPLVSDIFPELSTYTIEDVLTGDEPAEDEPEEITPAPTQEANTALKIVDYSDKAFAIVTAVKPPEDVLNVLRLHGTYKAHLKCGKGWIFSKRHLAAIKAKLSL